MWLQKDTEVAVMQDLQGCQRIRNGRPSMHDKKLLELQASAADVGLDDLHQLLKPLLDSFTKDGHALHGCH